MVLKLSTIKRRWPFGSRPKSVESEKSESSATKTGCNLDISDWHGVHGKQSGLGLVPAAFALFYALYFWPAVLANQGYLAPGDALLQSLPSWLSPKTLWNPYFFSGFPTVGNPTEMLFYPPARLLSLIPGSWNVFVVSAYVLAASGMFYFVYQQTRSISASIFSGLVFGVSGFMMIRMAHTSVIHTACWLPWILMSIYRLSGPAPRRWIFSGGICTGMMFLGGHPQIFLYGITLCGIYSLFIVYESSSNRVRMLFRVGAMLGLGVALAAVQIFPMLELAKHSQRAEVTYEFFNLYYVPVRQLSGLFFPYLFGGGSGDYGSGYSYFGSFNFYEVTGYVGILPLLIGMTAVGVDTKNRHIKFWASVALLSLLLTLGKQVPVLAKLMYYLPGFNQFRAPNRHFFEFTAALAVLSGLGIARLKELRESFKISWSKVLPAGAVLLGAMLYFSIRLVLNSKKILGSSLPLESHWSPLPWENESVGIPLIFGFFSVLLFCLWFHRPNPAYGTLLIVLLSLDLGVMGWGTGWYQQMAESEVTTVPESLKNLHPQLSNSHSRLFSCNGYYGALELGKPNLCMLWEISNVSGYGPLILERYAKSLNMDSAGIVESLELIESSNRFLDILSVGHLSLLLPEIEQSNPIYWSRNISSQEVTTFAVPNIPDVLADEIYLDSFLHECTDFEDQKTVCEIVVRDAEGKEQVYSLRAGEHTAEKFWPRITPSPAHRMASLTERLSPAAKQRGECFTGVIRFSTPVRVAAVELRWNGGDTGRLFLRGMSLRNSAASEDIYVLGTQDFLDLKRWKKVMALQGGSYWKNQSVLPRVQLVHNVEVLAAEEILAACKTSRLPDGSLFDSSQMALVEEPLELKTSYGLNSDRANLEIAEAEYLRISTKASEESLLVLGDIYYPGWEAKVDGVPAKIYQTNFVARGIVLPAGEHRVEFFYRPRSVYMGRYVSGLAFLGLLGMAWFPGVVKRKGSA